MSRVLIVDDIPEYIYMLQSVLPEGVESESALSIEEAKKIIMERPISLAIIDVRLNEADETNKDGILILEYIKKNYPDIKVIMISAYREFEFRMESLNKGAEYFLEKPVDPELLQDIVKKLLGLK